MYIHGLILACVFFTENLQFDWIFINSINMTNEISKEGNCKESNTNIGKINKK